MPLRRKGTVEILLVEDSLGDVYLTGHLLAEATLPVKLTIARDGQQALTMLADRDFQPAMIILDLNLPVMSGYEVLKRNPHKDIPVVIFSASSNTADVERGLSLGAREYVRKPMDMEGYRNAVVGMVRNWAIPEDDANGARPA
jgi:CheY-like chemotaxis protein